MPISSGIKAIFYDLDGTLRLSNPSGLEVFAGHAVSLGLPISAGDLQHAGRWEHQYFAESPELIGDRDEFSEDRTEFWVNYTFRQLQVLGAAPELARELAPKVNDWMTEHFRPADIILDEVYTTLEALRASGYYLGVMSNRFESYTEYLEERGLSRFFDLVIHAGEAGIRKPNPEVFHFMLARAGFSPSESLYVGDNYYADVVGARRAGLGPILYDRAQLFDEPDCPVISRHPQLLDLLGRKN